MSYVFTPGSPLRWLMLNAIAYWPHPWRKTPTVQTSCIKDCCLISSEQHLNRHLWAELIIISLRVLKWTADLWNCMSHDQRDLKEVIFAVFRLMKNIIFNKTESFVGRNNSDHAFQIFYSKSNYESMYHWFSVLEITVAKIIIPNTKEGPRQDRVRQGSLY